MSDTTSIQKSYATLEKQKQFDGYSQVVIVVDEDNGIEYTAGTNTGRTLTLTCPFGTQKMANDILGKVRGYQYQPYSATGAHIDPAAEIGDAVTVGGVYGGLFSKNVTHGPLYTADISAPGGEKINYKYEYKTRTDRKIQRQYKEMQATFTVQASKIAAEVSAREEQGRLLQASLNMQADSIAAEVSAREAQGEELRASLSLQADSIAAEVSAREAQGEELRASLSLQADSIAAEVSAREEQGKSLKSTLDQQAGMISAKVSQTGGDSSGSFGWELTSNAWTLKSNSTTVLTASKSGLEVKGIITATGGKIGGFDIQSNYLSYNGQTWGGTNTYGAYLGTSGLQLGKNFKVDMSGNLTAASGTFTGYVHAGSIQYGDTAGTLSGYAITDGSITGGQYGKLSQSTLSTYNLTSGITSSLASADFANGVFNEYNTAATVKCNSVRIENLYYTPHTIFYKNASGGTSWIRVLGNREKN